MPWTLLLDLRVLLGAALVATGIYAKVQTVRLEQAKAECAQYRANVESEAAKAKVKAAQEAASQAQHAQEVLDDLQTRYDALSARYASLLHAKPSSRPVPAVPSAAPVPSPVAGDSGESDADARCVAVLEKGDRELAKYIELWKLEKANAANAALASP